MYQQGDAKAPTRPLVCTAAHLKLGFNLPTHPLHPTFTNIFSFGQTVLLSISL